MKVATLGLIIENGKVLLAEKKKGEIGTGVLSGPGGKLDPNETLVECLIRETSEEWDITVSPVDIMQVGRIVFFAKGQPDFEVHVYRIRAFTGTLRETADAKVPEWYPIEALPFDRMYDGDRHWISRALKGEPFCAHVYYHGRAKEFDRIEFLDTDL